MDFKIYNRTKLIPRKFLSGGKYEEDWADKAEPWAAGLALTGTAAGLATAATGYGVGPGAIIALIANTPSAVIDGYQAIRDWVRAYNDRSSDTAIDAGINTAELALDLVGLKLLKIGVNIKSDRALTNELKGIIKEEVRKRQGQRFILHKKGMTDAEITAYIAEKAANAANNSKQIRDYKKQLEAKNNKTISIGKHIINIPTNTFNVMDAFRNNPSQQQAEPEQNGDPLGLFGN